MQRRSGTKENKGRSRCLERSGLGVVVLGLQDSSEEELAVFVFSMLEAGHLEQICFSGQKESLG